MPEMAKNISHLDVPCDDVERAKRFYGGASRLGDRPTSHADDRCDAPWEARSTLIRRYVLGPASRPVGAGSDRHGAVDIGAVSGRVATFFVRAPEARAALLRAQSFASNVGR